MTAPARIICPECLRSVDSSPPDGVMRCPHCGGDLDASASDSDSCDSETESVIDLAPVNFPWETCEPSVAFVSQTLGRYQLREKLGGGGFGQVYRAYDPRLDREVALKILKERNPSSRVMERFFREARIAGQLDHANIVALHDAGRDDGRCWIAYQFVSGPTMAALMEEGPVSPRRAAEMVRALADALSHSHARGVFHRDLKPSNILIDDQGAPRLTDFGLALRNSTDLTLTREGAVLGTPAYMSPEQAAGQGHAVDARSDIYSLGIVFYELLCGHRPCDLPSSLPAWRIDPRSEIIPPRRVRRSVPRALDRICRRALAANPVGRYPSAAALTRDLDAWLRPGRWTKPLLGALSAAIVVAAGCAYAAFDMAKANNQLRPVIVAVAKPAPSKQPQATPTATAEAAPIPERVPEAPRSDSAFVGNMLRQTYHRPSCRTLRRLSLVNRVALSNVEEAKSRGLRPCTICCDAESANSPTPKE